MSALIWDKSDERFYQTGIDNVALYVKGTPDPADATTDYLTGVAWSGVSSIAESPSGAESNKIYADNIEYLNLISAEELGLTVTAYDYPDEFEQCDGTATPSGLPGVKLGQQARKSFGLAYRTRVGSNEDGDSHGYRIHIVYNCKAAPSERTYNTVNESPEAIEFSWSISTTKEKYSTYAPIVNITIDSRKFTTTQQLANLKELEETLWGRDADSTANPAITALSPKLPKPAEVIRILSQTGG